MPLFLRKDSRIVARVGTLRANEHVALARELDDPYRALLREQRRSTRETESLALQPGYELVVDREASRACVDESR